MFRTLALLGVALALGLSGCVSSKDNKLALNARTPSELYPLKAEKQPVQVLLAVHGDGLSPAQIDAVTALAGRWREGGGETIQIGAPHGEIDSYAVYKTQQAVRDRLMVLGVPAASIVGKAYDAGGDVKAPLMIEFTRFEADVPTCGKSWENLSSTENNAVQSNFGCAITANMAAQIANAADIGAPRASDAPDAGRRVTVLDEYRQGKQTGADIEKREGATVAKGVGTQ